MSTLKANNLQIGQSGTATQNFVLSVPASPDGTLKIARGNQGATTSDILTIDASGNVTATTVGALVGTTGTQTLTNKTLTSPTISSATISSSTLTTATTTGIRYSRDDDGTITGGTWAIDYNNGPVIRAQAGANITSITMSNWPASGTAGHLRLMCVNFGAYTITFPAWNWIKSDLTTTTTFSGLGITLPSSGPCFIDLFSVDGGTTIYATIGRN